MLNSRVRASLVAAALVVSAGLLGGCSGDDGGDAEAEASGSSSTSTSASDSASPSGPETPYLPVPDGVTLSPQGSQLEVGDAATVAYEVKQGVVGVLDIKVTRLEKTSFAKSFEGWELDPAQKKSNPYFVRATVTNRGTTDLGERRVPLYIVDGTNTLVEPTTFASAFPPCEPGSFPKKFGPGKSAKVCLVFLSPKKGDLTAVSFRPTQEFDPITWTGPLQDPKPPKPPKGKGGKGGKGNGGGDQSRGGTSSG